ncbi:MAG: TonB-dependent receptor, partial [Ignavibacteria bacterium]|nr:TonB-dependent receptor [Ignavibacteria bacterium]
MKTIVVLLLLLQVTGQTCLFSQSHVSALSITGSVYDEDGAPIPYVNVFLLKTTSGAMTNEAGKFVIRLDREGEVNLVASCVGYEKYTATVVVRAPVDLKITLVGMAVKADEVVVTASSYGSEKEKGIVMSSMDVITTPGGAADIFQSLKTLPGLTQVSESAELYVRGGDPIETVTLVDQASLYHPYTFESAFGGIFSSLNTSSISSMFFSSGGFSAKYGNVLSGVLAVETRDHAPIPR